MAGRTIYKAGTGTPKAWEHPTLPDIVPGNPPPPPPPPPPPNGGAIDGLWFGTTLFGQSYARYKLHNIGSTQNRYNQVEYDTVWNGNRGGAVMREFGSNSDIGTFNNAVGNFRNDQPCIYSWKDGPNVSGKAEATFKADLRAFIDSKPVGRTTRIWLVFHHEMDNDGNMLDATNHTGEMGNWYDRNIWCREVLDNDRPTASARNGGWIKFGPIVTGTPFQHGRANTSTRSWKAYTDNMASHAGIAGGGANVDQIWDFWGCDKYNPAWDGSTRYLPFSDWGLKFQQANDYTGLPIVIGEAGSPRALNDLGQTLDERNQERATWLATQYEGMLNKGFYDASCYWRVPSLSNNLNAWSTNMITPNGYNATVNGETNGGFDDPHTCSVHSEYAVGSITQANALDVGPNIPYYTGSGGFG